MRRVTGIVVALGLAGFGVLGPAGPGVLAAPAPTAAGNGADQAARGKPVCTISDPKSPRANRMMELSGLGVLPSGGYVTVNDSTDQQSRQRIFFLDQSCKAVKEVTYTGTSPYDPEDLAVAKDGTVWVADIGDNTRQRANVGFWKVPPGGTTATYFKVKYPDGKFDAEAMLLDANDQPIIITKGPVPPSGIYTLAEPLAANKVVALKKVGEFKPERTGTSNPLGFIGQTWVTGGANSLDRKKVALRTYSDAYEWDVPDGDVVKAITTGKPRITPLPDEPQGEAITFSPDGASFLTVSEIQSEQNPQATTAPQILQYTPATNAKPTPAAGAGAKRNTLSWYERLSLTQATSLIAGVGVLGVLLVLAGVIGIVLARRKRASAAGEDPDPAPVAAVAGSAVAGRNPGGNVYQAGGAGYAPEPGGADEHWRGPGHAGTEYGSGQYSDGQYPGGQYGGGQYPGGQYGGGAGPVPGYGQGDPGYGPPAGYPPPGGR